ncbi:uncharacterized protein LOC134618137 isoform X1 [Pelmatolapia mariae]|uniref:uncharacterized protein LOC134618136 isoform X1 n=1 Tax=Pelmatolapia mariae TaxID=158779 RepID=UPI002FE63ECB
MMSFRVIRLIKITEEGLSYGGVETQTTQLGSVSQKCKGQTEGPASALRQKELAEGIGIEDDDTEDREVPPTECEDVEDIGSPDVKAELPSHLSITKDVKERCIHLLSDPSLRLRLKVLDVLELCVQVLSERENELLPMAHRCWPALLQRLTADDPLAVLRAFRSSKVHHWSLTMSVHDSREPLPDVVRCCQSLSTHSSRKLLQDVIRAASNECDDVRGAAVVSSDGLQCRMLTGLGCDGPSGRTRLGQEAPRLPGTRLAWTPLSKRNFCPAQEHTRNIRPGLWDWVGFLCTKRIVF